MKKIYFAILGTALLFTACSKDKTNLPKLEQNPFRAIVDYEPDSYTMNDIGTVTPNMDYDWIEVKQNGNSATFTYRRNTWDAIRRADFSIAGGGKAVIMQKGHALDASLDASLNSQSSGKAEISFMMATNYYDDYAGWGFLYGKKADPESATDVPQSGKPIIGNNIGTISGLEDGTDYFVWAYAESTEGNRVYSNMVAILPPVYVRAGENLQSAIDNAKEYSTIMVEGGTTFSGPILMFGNNKNKTISGGWSSDFKQQSMDNLTIIDGNNKSAGFICCEAADDTPLKGYVKISYMDIQHCYFSHGSAVHVCGGPVTVSNCHIHDNECEKGAIGTREETYSSDITVFNCIIENNTANAHGAAFGFGDGKSYEDQVKATIVSNLIINNASYKYDGYCGVYICYNNTDLVFVNNTVVGNFNYKEYGGEYPGMNHRGNVRCLHANNIIVGNLTSENVTPPVKVPYDYFFSFDNASGTFANNVYEGQLKSAGNANIFGNYMFDAGFNTSTVITTDYKPVGVSINGGTLKTLDYKENRDNASKSCDINALLGKFSKDLAGNPRVVNGKVDCGCYQAQ